MLARATCRLRNRATVAEIQQIPFFFCTRTIIRGFASETSPKTSSSGYIPFEGLDDRSDRDPAPSTSTITTAERKAFESLLTVPRKSRRPAESEPKPENGQPSEKPVEDELDRILDSTIAHANGFTSSRHDPELPDSVREIAQVAQERKAKMRYERTRQKRERESRVVPDTVLSDAVFQDFLSISQELSKASTDEVVWDIFQKRLLDRVRALKLDEPAPTKKRKSTKSSNTPSATNTEEPTDLQILTVTLPRHLVRVHTTLEHNFPSSPLTLAILPTLKSLGPATFALGATTRLYNAHLTALFNLHPTALGRITSVLDEMEREVYAFDSATYGLLRRILHVAAEARWGLRGPAMQILWGTERMKREIGGVWRWCRTVENQRQEEALKLARDREAETEREMRERGHDGGENSLSWHGIAEPTY